MNICLVEKYELAYIIHYMYN